MKDIPLLFSTPMVQALLAGRKTQTRRIIDVPDLIAAPDRFQFIGDSINRDLPRPAKKYDDRVWYEWQLTNSNEMSWIERCRWKKGDLLWVKENFRVNSWIPDDGELTFRYEADGSVSDWAGFDDEETFNRYWKQSCDDLLKAGHKPNDEEQYEDYDYKALRLRPNIFLPKAFARIWLQVTDVRVERLMDISEADAFAEGVQPNCAGVVEKCPSQHCQRMGCQSTGEYYHYLRDFEDFPAFSAIESFESLWQSINGVESWQANPWVWVVSFTVLSTTGKPDLNNL